MAQNFNNKEILEYIMEHLYNTVLQTWFGLCYTFLCLAGYEKPSYMCKISLFLN